MEGLVTLLMYGMFIWMVASILYFVIKKAIKDALREYNESLKEFDSGEQIGKKKWH